MQTPERPRTVARPARRGPSRTPTAATALLLAAGWLAAGSALGADPGDGEALFRKGEYAACAELAGEEVKANPWREPWQLLKVRAEMAVGRAEDARASLEEALRRHPTSLPLRLLGRDVYLAGGRTAEADRLTAEIERLVAFAPQRYANVEGRVALGRYFLLRGADARQVLNQFYDVALRESPRYVDGHLATSELALGKQDYALAAETLQKAPEDAREDPRYHYLLALAFSEDDRGRSAEALDAALKINPNHVDSLLLRADQLVDGERYEAASALLDRVAAVNPAEPRAWAYRAVLAHLRNDLLGEAAARKKALTGWHRNPEVDHLIGRKLSQKYRFAEGAASQRRALGFDPDYLPAKVQLCEDLLRLGEEEEGWKLAEEVFARDGYNVVAFNLMALRDRLKGFKTLEADGFVVRMDAREAALYGDRVLALLSRAKASLCATYEAAAPDPVIVEIFPQKKEFAVRTFGLPGADGLLGVCFGQVVTACSPASQGEDPSNWEAVLWHELCHVVTLSKTRNKMPRWLSEGISVHEEGKADPSWATSLTPTFREMILGDELTPLSRLSSAFLAPKTPMHLQFAYFESSLAVAFLVEEFGPSTLNGLLDDLSEGLSLNEALPVRTKTSLEELDGQFAQYARERAGAVAPGATWEEPDLPEGADSLEIAGWVAEHPKSFPGRRMLASALVAEEVWDEALAAIESLRELYPEYVGPENAYVLRAAVHRKKAEPADERRALEELVSRDGGAGSALLRLIELGGEAGDTAAQARDAERLLAINPLVPAPHRALARAAEALGRRGEAIAAYQALLLLEDNDPAEAHFRLASLMHKEGREDEARRQVLMSLEEAPRFLDAHRLLLELAEGEPGVKAEAGEKPGDRAPENPPTPQWRKGR